MVDPKHPRIHKENLPPRKTNHSDDLHYAQQVMDESRVRLLLSRLRSIPTESEFKIMLEQIRQEEKSELEAHVPKLDEKYINQKCDELVQMAREELVELKARTIQSYMSLHGLSVYPDKTAEVSSVSKYAINYLHKVNITLDDLNRLKDLIKEKDLTLSNSTIDPNAEDGFIKIAEKIIKSRDEVTFADSEGVKDKIEKFEKKARVQSNKKVPGMGQKGY